MQKWEYKIVKFRMPSSLKLSVGLDKELYNMAEEHQKDLNVFGSQGWEVMFQMNGYFYLKRRASE